MVKVPAGMFTNSIVGFLKTFSFHVPLLYIFMVLPLFNLTSSSKVWAFNPKTNSNDTSVKLSVN